MNTDFALRSFEYQLDATTRDSFHVSTTRSLARLDDLGKPLKRGQLLFNSFPRRPQVQFRVQRASTFTGHALETKRGKKKKTQKQFQYSAFPRNVKPKHVFKRKMKTTVSVVDAESPKHPCDISPV